jgi:predicted phage terminase large subunit-like protein
MDLQDIIDSVPVEKKGEILKLINEYEAATGRELAQSGFLEFAQAVWPDIILGEHIKIMANAFERIVSGELKRLIINMAPRHSKSEMSSFLLPSYFLGKYPKKKLIQSSHNADLAVDFGSKVRNLIASEEYKAIFPDTDLRADKKAAGKWATTAGGEYFAIGVGGKIAGRGADLYIIDDPHSEQDALEAIANPDKWDKVYDWYTGGPRQRLQPGGAIVIVMTRWSPNDLTGQLLESQRQRGVCEWEVIELPAILPSGKTLWPEFWPEAEILAVKAELPVAKWQAQYQQNPTSEEGALIKREQWQEWPLDKPPECYFKIVSWDTAFLKTERSDYSACTVWGVFDKIDKDGTPRASLILLDAFKGKFEFPELKREVLRVWRDEEPDMMIVEQKASGTSLISELRYMGVPVQEFTPTRGNDKIARVNSVTDLFASGLVWHPKQRWAYEVIEECAAFPSGRNDDFVDASTQALIRFRQGGFIRTNLDEDEVEHEERVADYY